MAKVPAWGILLIGAGLTSVAILALALGLSYGISSGQSAHITGSLPLVKPPVQGAAPPGLTGNSSNQTTSGHGFQTESLFQIQSLSPQSIVDRFFNPDGGPTNLFQILTDVDAAIKGVNDRIDQFPCMHTVVPVEYTLTTWTFNHTFYAQCSETVGNGWFGQWAVKDHIFYLFIFYGETSLAARVQNYNSSSLNITVDVWFSVGGIDRNGSHAVVQIFADPNNKIFEMTVAGNGIGYCGAQLRSNATVMNITGSSDMGATCLATDSSCVESTDVLTTATCGLETFKLPAIGRNAYHTGADDFGASQYGKLLYFNAQGKDVVDFGPRVPTV